MSRKRPWRRPCRLVLPACPTAGACGYVAVEDPWEGLRRFMRRDFELQASDRGLREFVLDRADSTELGRRSRERIQPLVAELVEPARAGTKTCPPWYQPRS